MINVNFMPKLQESGISRYSLVVAVAKRAREITDEAAELHAANSKEILVEKPVSIAIEEFLDGAYDIVTPDFSKQKKANTDAVDSQDENPVTE